MTDKQALPDPSRILVVEDEGLISLRIEELLTGLGYEVTGVVSSGEEALQSVEEHPPDLVLMDINLAGEIDGIETAARIRARRDVPLVYLSAYPERMMMEEIQHTQPYGFLVKPVRGQELGATVEMALYKHRMEIRLRESEEKYRLLAENVEDVIWQVNETLDGYTYISPSITRLLGYTPEEMMAMPLEANLTPAFRSQSQPAIERRLAAEREKRGGDTLHVWEAECVHKDGTTVWVESRTRPLRDEDGVFRGLVGVARDITARKQVEEALGELHKRLRTILDSIDADIYVSDIETYEVLFLNQHMRASFGENLVGEICWDVFRGESGPCAHCTNEQLLDADDDPAGVVVWEGQNPITGNWYLNHDRAIRWVDGRLVRLQIATDITERKRAEEALRAAKERLQILHEIDAAILAAQSPYEIAHAALLRLRDLIPCQRASVAEIDHRERQGRELVVLTGQGISAKTSAWYPLSNAGALIEAIGEGQVYWVEDLATLETLSPLEQMLMLETCGLRSYVSVPLLAQDTSLGSLNLASDTPGFFQPDHVEILEEVAASLAIAMQQANLLEQTRRDAETKALLLRDVNHRVMNNLDMILSIINLEMKRPRRDEREEAILRAVLQDVYGRIQGMVAVHRMLSDAQQDALDLGGVISQVIDAALSGSPIQDQVAVVVDSSDDLPRVSSKQAVALALIINELTTNSVKYAFAERSRGQIRVRIERLEMEDGKQGMRLVFGDDGPGWPEDVLVGERHSMGLWLIQASATHTLGGQVTWRNADGAVVEIQFPGQPSI